MTAFKFADLHCHPNLKTFGHTFKKKAHRKQNIWYTQKPNALSKLLEHYTGICKFTQTDLTTMSKAGSKVSFVSLYPFEKGFFLNSVGKGKTMALMAGWATGIGYERVRHLQQHTNYFEDLAKEYQFFISSQRSKVIEGQPYTWVPTSNWPEVERVLNTPHEIAVVFTIEGAHVFNTGLSEYGREIDEEQVLQNIRTLKSWEFPPVFITLAHNFNNDFCGHARSLEPIERYVDQRKNLGEGIMPLGEKVLNALLDDQAGRRIYIDLKHMSLKARKAYYDFLNVHYPKDTIPLIVSHGALTGVQYSGEASIPSNTALFYQSDINFFDEEIVNIGQSGGLFAIQFDSRRLTSKSSRNSFDKFSKTLSIPSTQIIWNHIRHIAELLDLHGLFAWGTACIGSDYDGTIKPLSGMLTVEAFPTMAQDLLFLASEYLKQPNRLTMPENKQISPEELVERFCYTNAIHFLHKHF